MADKTKRIDIRVTENQLLQIDKLAKKVLMNRSEFLISSALNKQITIIKSGKEIAFNYQKSALT